MSRNLQYAFLAFLTLGMLGLVSLNAGMFLAGSMAESCLPGRPSLEKTSFVVIWIGSLCLGSLIPSVLIWKQRVYGALISTLPFGLCSCCVCMVYVASACK